MLNPESITVLDPACGSGHILVVAYDVLKAIYLERGYRPRDIPRLILEKNLYGLDIDDRAAQLAGFALLMKARADDRRLLDDPPRLNVLALQKSKEFDADMLARDLGDRGKGIGDRARGFAEDDLFPGTLPQMSLGESVVRETSGDATLTRSTIAALIDTFGEAKTVGSLIQVSPTLAAVLPEMEAGLLQALDNGDVFARAAAEDLLPLVRQARVLAMQFDAVVANPPYMGSGYFSIEMKRFAGSNYSYAKGDLYTCFMARNTVFAKSSGFIGMITIPNWMFLSSFADFRSWLFQKSMIGSLSHNGRGVFGSDFGSCAFVLHNSPIIQYKATYKRLFEKIGSVAANDELSCRFQMVSNYEVRIADFIGVSGSPVAYWAEPRLLQAFRHAKLGDITEGEGKNVTADNERFLRRWWEVSLSSIGRDRKWILYAKGGDYRKWAGNLEYVCNWSPAARQHYKENNASRIIDEKFWYREGITWTVIATSGTAFRYLPSDTTYDTKGLAVFFGNMSDIYTYLGLLNSTVGRKFLTTINPTMCVNTVEVKSVPVARERPAVWSIVKTAVQISAEDWNNGETSIDFVAGPVVRADTKSANLPLSWALWVSRCAKAIKNILELEKANNALWIAAYELDNEISPDVSEDQITLARAGREKDCQRLISYAIGCMMGRYRMDRPGLIYAHSGNQRFAEIYDAAINGERRQGDGADQLSTNHYPLSTNPFPPDADGIVPITDTNWFEDDAANRIREFLLAVWGAETVNENMAWLAESLGSKSGETPDETIRRYLSASFFKDHLQTYKRRPIYWCFSSGKQKAFEALVYLHRYHEGTLARMRMEYVVPLQGKMAARIERLGDDIASASTSAQAKRLQKERDKLTRQLDELRRYDEQLRHYADQRIALDLDDGVKVNYAKFGNLLAEVKAVTGTSAE